MASDIRLRVGGAGATLVFGGTDQQVADVLRRFAEGMGIPTTGTANEQLAAVLEHIRDEVKRTSKEVHTRQLRAENEATILATVETQNPI